MARVFATNAAILEDDGKVKFYFQPVCPNCGNINAGRWAGLCIQGVSNVSIGTYSCYKCGTRITVNASRGRDLRNN